MKILLNLIQIMKLLKYEYESLLHITEQELEFLNVGIIEEEIRRIKSCLEKISVSMDDANLLALIQVFLKHDYHFDLSIKKDLFILHYNCNQMKSERSFLSERLNDNENKIKYLESENIKLKNELNCNSPVSVRSKSMLNEMDSFNPSSTSTKTQRLNNNDDKGKSQRQKTLKMKLENKVGTLYDLVMQYTVRGNYAVAVPLCLDALSNIEKTSGKYCNEYSTILQILANVYKDIGDYDKSINVMLDSFDIQTQIDDFQQSEILDTLNSLSALYGLVYKWDESGKYCLKSIELIRKMYGNDDVRLAKELENMAIILKNNNKVEEAIPYFKQSCTVYQKNLSLFDVVRIQSLMAECYLYMQNFTEALKLYKKNYDFQYHSTVSNIWGINKSLWQIAEEYELSECEDPDNMQINLDAWRNNDKLDEQDLRNLLLNMAKIYRLLGKNKASRFLKRWPNFNILAKNNFGLLQKSSSLMQLNDGGSTLHKLSKNSLLSGSRQRLFNENFRNGFPRKSIQQSNKIDENVIYESWTKCVPGNLIPSPN